MIVFGPVPSRRLGRSLGVNNIIPKHCSYSCTYCQLGVTRNLIIERREFYNEEIIFNTIKEKIEELKAANEKIDFITFVPDGEPTLDINLGKEIQLIKFLDIPVAVITNSSLLYIESVREDLMNADLVSTKIDSVNNSIFLRLNRPHHLLSLSKILEGIVEFAGKYKGKLITETMLVRGLNDSQEELNSIASFIAKLNPFMSYISIPTRPPAEKSVEPPTEEGLFVAYEIFLKTIGKVSMLVLPEEGHFTVTEDIEEDLLNILSVHPMREDEVRKLFKEKKEDFSLIKHLLNEGKIKQIEFKGTVFYMRNLEKIQ